MKTYIYDPVKKPIEVVAHQRLYNATLAPRLYRLRTSSFPARQLSRQVKLDEILLGDVHVDLETVELGFAWRCHDQDVCARGESCYVYADHLKLDGPFVELRIRRWCARVIPKCEVTISVLIRPSTVSVTHARVCLKVLMTFESFSKRSGCGLVAPKSDVTDVTVRKVVLSNRTISSAFVTSDSW